MHFETLYDLEREGFLYGAAWLFGIVAGLACLVSAAFADSERVRRARQLGGAFILLVAGGSMAALYAAHRARVGDLRAGRFVTVEGAVEQFVPAVEGSHPPESWVVDGYRYVINPAILAPGFRTYGIVRPGQRVRIADAGGEILRLEVERPGAAAP